ncbi:hypothetical protein J416_10716 [Gracilibacillus halophilus YIM-C55.5]|uniref:DUF4064 domain-containing protein n=1 Tax=Gracilibacillus halophilus YIM-C55.5 TaxID=1308866 RepID=N4WB48_9BACI|nr:DUF4064 domain-containing protein [Gracilibacillus halophilus]ENH96479.1 hypothetical protein J416_10716 [Gracilibacillus halophilus YIM-C55.5]
MKRTAEVVLAIIGAFVYGLFGFFGVMFLILQNNEEFIEQSLQNNPAIEGGQTIDPDLFMQFMGVGGTIIIVGSLICVALGIVAMVLFKGDNKPKPASIILIIVGALTTVITFGGAIFAGIFYVIAGIMGLVRKKKPEAALENY